MPETRLLTQDELRELQAKGVDITSLVGKPVTITSPEEERALSSTLSDSTGQVSSLGAAGRTLKAHAGGILGGGGGTLGGIALAESTPLAHIFPPYSEIAVPIVMGIAGGFAGGAAGQKAQDTLQGKAITEKLQQDLAQAHEQHPFVTIATDIAASALASGGKPSTDIFTAGKGLVSKLGGAALKQAEKESIAKVALAGGINPAIHTGISLAQGQGIPSLKDLGEEAVGGAIFAGQNRLGRWASGHGGNTQAGETQVEPLAKEPVAQVTEGVKATSPYTSVDEEGLPVIADNFVKQAFMKRFAQPVKDVEGLSPEDTYARKTGNKRLLGTPIEEMWQKLHDAYLEEQTKSKIEEASVLTEEQKQNLEALSEEEQKELEEMKLNAPPKEENTPSDLEEYRAKYAKMQELLNKGEYDTPEFKQVWQEMENVKNRNKGMPPSEEQTINTPETPNTAEHPVPESLQRHIIQGRATVGSVLQHIAYLDKNNPYQPLAEHLLKILPKEKQADVVRMYSDLNRSEYNSGRLSGRIGIAKSQLGDTQILMHEISHAATVHNLPREWNQLRGEELFNSLHDYISNKSGNESIKELVRSYFQAAKELGVYDILFKDKPFDYERMFQEKGLAGAPDKVDRAGLHYGMGNPFEFIAEMWTNKKFQEDLNHMPSGMNDGRSLWTRIVDAIKHLLGVDVKQGSLLERALKATGEIAEQRRPGFEVREAETFNAPPAKDINEKDTSRQGFVRAWTASFDRVKAKSLMLYDAFQRERATRDSIKALGTAALEDLKHIPTAIQDKVFADHRESWRHGTPLPEYKGLAKEASDIFNRYYVDQIGKLKQEEGPKIDGREANITKQYVNDSMNDKSLDILTKNPTSEEGKFLKSKWIDYVVKESNGAVTREEATHNISNYIEALGGQNNNYRSLEFGAVRKAAGYGLPEGMRETSAFKALSKYSNRVAADLAFFKEIQNRPEISGSLKIKDQFGQLHTGHPNANPDLASDMDVKNAMRWITGNYTGTISKTAPLINSFSRLVNNSIMGLGTGLRNTAQVPVMAIPYIHDFGSLKAFFAGMSKFRQEARNALETGARQPQMDTIVFDTIKDGPNQVVNYINKAATFLRKWQGREMLENFDRNVTFAAGKEMAKYNIIGAQKGNANSRKFLEQFGLNVKGDITTLKGAELETALNQMAKNFVDRNQGTYGGAGLALGVVDSPLAPFLALQKWSLEKQNVIYQDVVKPFLSGENRLPLITYTLGSVLSGAAIQQLNQIITNRKAYDPTAKEALVKGDASAIVSELATLMQLSSFSGMVGDAMKAATDAGLHGKTPRNIISFPAFTSAMDTGNRVSDMLEALRNGENPWDVWKAFSLDMLMHNIQTVRMLANYTTNKKNVEQSDKFRDIRVFNELEHGNARDFSTANPYLGLGAREYKQSQNPEDIARMLPQLIAKAIQDSKGDPFELKRRLSSLKNNSYQTMPNMENSPLSFMRYITYLQRTQGIQAAQDRLQDYIFRNALNRAKSAAVPRL